MLVSWNWLKEYVTLDMPVAELERRLMMAGLNHESTADVAGDLAIDLEVTSNRPDCLGHLGIAREIAVLWYRQLKIPAAAPRQGPAPVSELTQVRLDCPELCYRYTARVVRGVKVGPSPKWMTRRLATVGIAAINNVVDITNYVLLECGQPLHAFDLARVAGRRIIVREAQPGERFEAINHKFYELQPGMCVIADAERAAGLGGVMGGANTEVTPETSEILIEAAEFSPLSIRNTARKLNLHSDSSYRFERGVDPEGVEWASRRCAELVLELAGGELAAGVIDVGRVPPQREPIVLRLDQIKRILGIEVPRDRVMNILESLGLSLTRSAATHPAIHLMADSPPADLPLEVVPPSWRRDLAREIDVIEEVGRIHGYDAIPEDVSVPMAPSARTDTDRVLEKVRHVLTAAGYDEAQTASVVEERWSEAFSPWTSAPALCTQISILRGADRLRRSLVPSLLVARRTNESLANPEIELFEIARVYLPQAGKLPAEEPMLALSSGGDFYQVKAVIEALTAAMDPELELDVRVTRHELFDARACELLLKGEVFGYLAELNRAGLKRFDLRGSTTVAEIKLAALTAVAKLAPRYVPPPQFPAIERDLNFVVDERVRWADLARTVRQAGGPLMESLQYKETYRDPQRLGAGKKSLVLSFHLRAAEGTLTSEEADRLCREISEACQRQLGAELRA